MANGDVLKELSSRRGFPIVVERERAPCTSYGAKATTTGHPRPSYSVQESRISTTTVDYKAILIDTAVFDRFKWYVIPTA